MSTKRVEITKDEVEKVLKGLRDLLHQEILVGIPESKSHRDDGPANSAMIGYAQEFGSPATNLPARPFLIPGVQKATPAAIGELRKAIDAALAGNAGEATNRVKRAGEIALNGAKNEIQNGAFVPLSPETIRNRKYSRNTKSMRKGEKLYLDLVAGGMSPGDAQTAVGIKPLINTGALRDSLAYVVVSTK